MKYLVRNVQHYDKPVYNKFCCRLHIVVFSTTLSEKSLSMYKIPDKLINILTFIIITYRLIHGQVMSDLFAS